MPAERLNEEFQAQWAFICRAIRWTTIWLRLKRKGVMTLDEVTAKAENGALVCETCGCCGGVAKSVNRRVATVLPLRN